MAAEIWKPVKDYENLYEVSNFGKIRSLKKNKLKTEQLSKNGYSVINLYVGKSIKREYLHRIVAQAFIPNLDNKPQVNHIDGNKQNNHVENLEWVTSNENLKHAYKMGLRLPSSQNITLEQVKYIKQNPKNLSRKQLAKELNISYWSICNIYQGRTFKEVS